MYKMLSYVSLYTCKHTPRWSKEWSIDCTKAGQSHKDGNEPGHHTKMVLSKTLQNRKKADEQNLWPQTTNMHVPVKMKHIILNESSTLTTATASDSIMTWGEMVVK